MSSVYSIGKPVLIHMRRYLANRCLMPVNKKIDIGICEVLNYLLCIMSK